MANKYHWHVLTVIQPHWICPCSWRVCFPSLHCSDCRLLCWELSDAGPGFCVHPRSKPLRFRFLGTPQRRRLGWAYILCSSQVQTVQVTRCLVSAVAPSWRLCPVASPVPAAWFSGYTMGMPSQVCCVSLLGADLWLQPSQQILTVQHPKKF